MTSWPANGLPLSGVSPPIVTPLLSYDKIDEESTAKLLDYVIDAGCSGVFVLGTNGEFPSLTPELRAEYIKLCCKLVNGRVPVLVGISDNAFATTLMLSKVAKEAGASAVVLLTPFYFPLEQWEVIRYVEQVLDKTELPIILYNIPWLTKVPFAPETLDFLTKYPQIIGIKDSGGDMDYFKEVCKLKSKRPDWSILLGPETKLALGVSYGCDGAINGGSNIEPALFVAVYKAAKAGDMETLKKLEERVNALQAIYEVGNQSLRLMTPLKTALEHRGIITDVMAEPYGQYTAEEKSKVKEILEALPPMP